MIMHDDNVSSEENVEVEYTAKVYGVLFVPNSNYLEL